MPLPFLADGAVASCGALLVVAGAGKAYASARRTAGDDAIRRALRVPRATWRLILAAAAVIETGVGGGVLAVTLLGGSAGLPARDAAPTAAGIALTALGATFCALLCYARLRRTTGGCGCLGGKKKGEATVTWREIARSALLACGGMALSAALPPATLPAASPGTYTGFLLGAAFLTALSRTAPPSLRDRCRRPLWRPVSAGAREVAASAVFAEMAASVGPFLAAPEHWRDGCADEYRYAPADAVGRTVLFTVTYRPGGGPAAIRARLADAPALGAAALPAGATAMV